MAFKIGLNMRNECKYLISTQILLVVETSSSKGTFKHESAYIFILQHLSLRG